MFNPLNLLSKIIKSGNQKELDRIGKIVSQINGLEKKFENIDNSDFPKKTSELVSRLNKGEKINQILPEAFALVREASKRVHNERHFDVQLIGGVALHENKIAEMKTGEGKTLTITLAAYLNALEKKGVHIVTVNDYLAKRDSQNMGEIYEFLGLSCGFINTNQSDLERKENYMKDITYATNSELGFDYLRDNMKFSKKDMVQRGHNYAIVDEIDSCLIDEARTPLIISGAAEDKTSQYIAIDKLVKTLKRDDFDIDEKDKNILLTNKGIDNIEKIFSNAGILKNNNFYDPENLHLVHHVNQALKANHLFQNGRDYIVKDDQIIIIDEQTGRQLPGRRFGDGLHQSLEAKEKLVVNAENQTLASITYQNFFKLYKKISGCTGTAQTESEEFFEIYNLPVVSIPTNKEMIRKDWNDQIFRTLKEKDDAIIEKIIECNQSGQPLLVFTASINKSEHYSDLLNKKDIKHIVLNAKNHEKEAEIIANAGKINSIIITTSISGRGVDIKLGGQDESEKEKVKKLGGLFVIGTERMESRRVDNQARGRSGRQGDEGNSIFFVSLEDDLMRIFGSESMNNILEKLGLKDGESIDHPWINKALERAQQKVEARNFDIRKTLLKFDNVLNDQRQVIFSQRNNVMESKEANVFADDFIDENLNELKILKSKKLANPTSDDFTKSFKNIFGKSFDDERVKEISNINDAEFEKIVKDKFSEKREERISLLGKNEALEIEKRIFLQLIDQNWKLHIQYLEQLRQVIGLRSYGQRDPLVEYKKEAFLLFENLLNKLKTELITFLINVKVIDSPEKDNNFSQEQNKKFNELSTKKIGRNEPCPCNSGKKYKHCCGSL
ncbi:preprotein translocase subunit SecA [Candidatus Pelagibacter communis]|uniref:preprotein translocase subunit SecA n=1 Tax=Pelagibacter ubique TaxID=198252 RepID=UPI00094D866A|nr:preprotein translocase subunit SecA [Candidatus Pelagibacter ubique]